MPEPPAAVAFDISGAGKDAYPAKQPEDTRVLVISAATGNVPDGASVRVTNLDTIDPVVAGVGNTQGGFEVDLIVTGGQELRFEWVNGAERSAPADAIVSRASPTAQLYELNLAPRFECLQLSPGFVLDFGAQAQATLGVENACDEAIELSNPRTRLALADFGLPAELAQALPAGESRQLTVNFARAAAGLREDVLFIDITLAATTIRYPITLHAE